MLIYEEEGRITLDDLLKLRKSHYCQVCGGRLNVFMDANTGKAFLACNDWNRTHHDGIEREASRFEKEGLASLNIKTRSEIMEQDYGPKITTALDKYMGVVSLTKPQAKEILQAVYPEAPEDEIARAVLLCASYGLNPLMKHVFLIKFNRWNKGHTQIIGEDWATVIGIKAKRLLASRRGSYSYIDNTPRVMTEQEQRTTFGEIDATKLWVITKLKDPATGAEAVGYGFYLQNEIPKGVDKGNSKFNMAAIRSESQGIDRLRPGEMPMGVEVMPEEVAEAAIEAEYTEVKEEPKRGTAPLTEPKPKEHWCVEHNCAFDKKTKGLSTWYAHKLPDGTWCNEIKKKETASKQAPKAEPEFVAVPEKEVTEGLTEEEQIYEAAKADQPEAQQPKRDPETIKNLNELYKACNEDWGMQPSQVIAELGVNCQSDISDTPADCYRKIAAVR